MQFILLSTIDKSDLLVCWSYFNFGFGLRRYLVALLPSAWQCFVTACIFVLYDPNFLMLNIEHRISNVELNSVLHSLFDIQHSLFDILFVIILCTCPPEEDVESRHDNYV